MFTPEEYAKKAADMWLTFTPNEKALVSMGIFPYEKMNAVEALGYETHPLVVALMKVSREAILSPRTR